MSFFVAWAVDAYIPFFALRPYYVCTPFLFVLQVLQTTPKGVTAGLPTNRNVETSTSTANTVGDGEDSSDLYAAFARLEELEAKAEDEAKRGKLRRRPKAAITALGYECLSEPCSELRPAVRRIGFTSYNDRNDGNDVRTTLEFSRRTSWANQDATQTVYVDFSPLQALKCCMVCPRCTTKTFKEIVFFF